MKTNESLISSGKIASDKRKKIFFLKKELADDELRRLVRRAVKNTAIPADLESRVLSF